jgi:amidase
LMARRIVGPNEMPDSFKNYFARSANPPFKTLDDLLRAPDFIKVHPYGQNRLSRTSDETRHYASLIAQDELMTNVMKIMADNKLDAIVYKSVEHQPATIKDGVNPPFVNTKGANHLNTFLVFVPVIAVPAGFTVDNVPQSLPEPGRYIFR